MILSRKRKTKEPCPGCFLHKTLCICALIPTLETKTRLTLIVHAKELKRTTNTGRLALKAISNSSMRVRGQGKDPVDLSDLLTDEYQTLLFYPSDNAANLTEEYLKQFSKPFHLLVPDGSWRQASKVPIRHQELANVPRVMISKPNLATQHLRAENSEVGMSTLQAIAEAFRVLEGESVYNTLNDIYKAKLKNTLRGRGQIFTS